MNRNPGYEQARRQLLQAVEPVKTERLPLSQCAGRFLAEMVEAQENVPAFDRSPYDGYAFCAKDTAAASENAPVTLKITEEIPAGKTPTKRVGPGEAAKVLTGAPIPPGADAVIMYERTRFSKESVTLFGPVRPGSNIVRAGEDIQAGTVLARPGEQIDPGLAGVLASQGLVRPKVYQRPRVGLVSTGSELTEAVETPESGKIRNSSRYALETALWQMGCEPVYFGIAPDRTKDIAALLEQALETCDALITTGGVSAGDYDVTSDAMEMAGVDLLFRGVDMKPGMACAYGVKERKPVCGLSGNPASALTNFYAVAAPALRKLGGASSCLPQTFPVALCSGFKKKSPKTRFLRGKLILHDEKAQMQLPQEQGNVVLSSAIGCNMMAVVPAGSGALETGTVLKGFLI